MSAHAHVLTCMMQKRHITVKRATHHLDLTNSHLHRRAYTSITHTLLCSYICGRISCRAQCGKPSCTLISAAQRNRNHRKHPQKTTTANARPRSRNVPQRRAQLQRRRQQQLPPSRPSKPWYVHHVTSHHPHSEGELQCSLDKFANLEQPRV